MKITTAEIDEVTRVYEAWVHAYLNGDVETYDLFFDDQYHFIGSTANEHFLDRKSTTRFFAETADQLSGKTEIKNKTRVIEKFEGIIFVTEIFDCSLLIQGEWTYYGKFRFTSALKKNQEGWRFIYQHFSTPDVHAEEGETIGTEKIAAENLMLREAVKRRTFELEEKNRELEIESALERVRSRSMAMQNSTELNEVAFVLFEQLRNLGGNLWGTGFALCTGNSTADQFWFANEKGILPPVNIPHTDDPVHNKLYLEWGKKSEFFAEIKDGAELRAHYNYMLSLPEVKPFFQVIIDAGFTFPEWQQWNAAFFSRGYLLIISLEPYPEPQTLVRFAKVFDQAYTRFLDLQKAEDQTREAQIEVVVERVRAEAMAMHSTRDFEKVTQQLLKQIKTLNLDGFTGASICLIDESQFMSWWDFSSPGNIGDPQSQTFRYDARKYKILGKDVLDKWQQGESYMLLDFNLEKLHAATKEWEDINIDVAHTFRKVISEGKLTHQWNPCGRLSKGFLTFDMLQPPTDDVRKITIKMAHAFDQAYTRFLDLQKAEAQAREAQIEAALERIRGKVTAMKESTELLDIVVSMRTEFVSLGHQADYFWYMRWLPEKYQKAMTSGDGTRIGMIMELPRHIHGDIPLLAEWEKSDQPAVVFAMDVETAVIYIDKMIRLGDFTRVDPQAPTLDDIRHIGGLTFIMARTTHGEIGYSLAGPVPHPPAEDVNTLVRLAAVFDLAYRRFEDLKLAEQRNRQTLIDLALERTRTQSMLMQQSNELLDISKVFHEQLLFLQIEAEFSFVWLPNEEKGDHLFWATWMEEKEGDKQFHTKAISYPLDLDEPYTAACFRDWHSGEPVHEYFIKPEEVAGFFASWEELLAGADQLKATFFPAGIYYTEAYMRYGCFGVDIRRPLSAEEKEILLRFAIEFERTYTRFLDLQKAEAQARAARIEASLEKVRARTMGMHHSAELQEAASLLFEEVIGLGVSAFSCGYNLFKPGEKECTAWMSNHNGGGMNPVYHIPLTEDANFIRFDESKQKGEDFYVLEMTGERMQEHYRYLRKINPEFDRTFNELLKAGLALPENQFHHLVNFEHGNVMFITLQRVPEAYDIFKRFGKIFEQTYTRFLDLQKAEAQAREAQIETALERVRSRTMGMQRSEELQETAVLLFQQISGLGVPAFGSGFNIWDDDRKYATAWMAGQDRMQPPFKTSSSADIFLRIYEAAQNGETLFVEEQAGEALKIHYAYMNTIPVFKEIAGKMAAVGQSFPPFQIMHCVFFSQGYLMFITFEPVPDSYDIFKRFAKVFEQTYTRFLDLQKAEAQAREAQTEAALERVRSRTMAMHKSEELSETSAILFNELKKLDIQTTRSGFGIYNESNQSIRLWLTALSGQSSEKSVLGEIPFQAHQAIQENYTAWKENKSMMVHDFEGNEVKNYYENIGKYLSLGPQKKYSDRLVFSAFFFSEGSLNVMTDKPLTGDEYKIVMRFANVFGLTYRRFLDLQKAEAQAREAQIEAALERVRSRSMGMQKSEELQEVIQVVFRQLVQLNMHLDHAGFVVDYQLYGDWTFWIADEQAIPSKITHPYFESIWATQFNEAKHTGKDYFVTNLNFEEKNQFYHELLSYIPGLPEATKAFYFNCPGLAVTTVLFKDVSLYIENFEGIPYSDEENKILIRFGKVFQQTYTRFLDLQKVEAQVREATKRASVDRVRAEIASMRTKQDLDRITPLIWKELTALNIPFVRCGVFIMNDENQTIHTFLSTPDGRAIAAFELAYAAAGHLAKAVSNWREHKYYVTHWLEKDFYEQADTLVAQGALSSRELYMATIPKEGIFLHFLPFLQGMLYVGNLAELNVEQLDLIQAVADALSTAYARYEDFNKLEAAKQQVDKSLTELKQAQQQLVQSEKMASLGELTAGIAHEIQNPLNFVNNFSEVNKELLAEMQQAIKTGDYAEVSAIANDISENQEKINHHGKRAEGIVKSMLQHSRTSSGQKELTDLNALFDEYLRLSYHGYRAKDKTFHAKFETRFDDALPKIHVVPQDMGRVALNLINNAFFAVNEKAKLSNSGYQPQVTITTKHMDHNIEISVKDNGGGISAAIKEKIFQPFFTTKPTGQGTGLGLSLTYDIIKAHGGELELISAEGEGSTFIVKLPI